ncbi:hypothetical protein Nepgr_020229 [Nepenthes gracilis]|uniref:Uncharacterized protein n=1 Tax=Nepenthes gracilis TaxID=150966 RepID=A0AAD3XV23_NEPGR|nr:hypothetical protein Nepgr_020229 [Nepenthes gracilis]
MDSSERSRSYMKRDIEEVSIVKSDRAGDAQELEGNEKRKHNSSKSRNSSNGDENDGWDGTGRRKSSGDRNDFRKRSGGSSRGNSDEDDAKKEIRSLKAKKQQEASTLEKLSNWYQDGELETKHDGRGHNRMDERGRNLSRKTTSKVSDHEGSQGRSKSKEERSQDVENEKAADKDSRFSERRESSLEKGHRSSEQKSKPRRRWDESDAIKNTEESSYVVKGEPRGEKVYDSRHDITKERSSSARLEISDGKGRGLDSYSDKGKSYSREERKAEAERTNSRSWSDAVEEDTKASPLTREDKSAREKNEKYREQRTTSRDGVQTQEGSLNPEEDDNIWNRDKDGREVGHSRRSRTPERSGRHLHVSDNYEISHERSSTLKRKELENEGYREEGLKSRDDSWGDRSRDREGSRENRKRRQPSSSDKDGDVVYDRDREWEFPRRARDRIDYERHLGRAGNRKDGRSEAVKASSNFGISTENYDVIEIQPKPLDYGREELGSTFPRRNEVQQSDPEAAAPDEWAIPQDNRLRTAAYGSAATGDNLKEKYMDEATPVTDQNPWRDNDDNQGWKSRGQKGSGRPGDQKFEPDSFGRVGPQGVKVARGGRGNRVRPSGRDNQQVSIPLPLMGSPFGPIGIPPPGQMQPLNPNMSPAPGPLVPPGVFIPPFLLQSFGPGLEL